MADSDRSREGIEGDASRKSDPARRGLGFPPGRHDDWSCVPEYLWPSIGTQDHQLEVRLLADGLESRIDLLRLAGNGVVPQQAELAVMLLAEQLATTDPDACPPGWREWVQPIGPAVGPYPVCVPERERQ